MTSNEFITQNYTSLRQKARRIMESPSKDQLDEFLHYVLEIFLKRPDVEAICQEGKPEAFILRIMLNSWRSTTSPYWVQYRKRGAYSLEETQDEVDALPVEDNTDVIELAESVTEALNKLEWYDQMLFKTFVDEGHTISSLAKATGIPRTSISLSINRIRQYVKANL